MTKANAIPSAATTVPTAAVPSPYAAELQAVLQNQQALAAAQASVAQLRTVIAEHQAKAGTLGAQAAALKAMETEREDLLADIATGQDKGRELAALNARLDQQREALTEQGSHAAVEQTVAGLQRKLERAESDVAALQGQHPDQLRRLLLARAEALGAEYKAAALQLHDTFDRLSIHCRLLAGLGHRLVGLPGSLQLPAFPMESAQANAGVLNPRFIVDTTHQGREALDPVLAQEKAALRALGVEID